MSKDFQVIAALFGQGRFAEAEQAARKLTRKNHGNGMAWKALSVAIKLQGRTAEALDPMKTAAALLPGDPEASNNLGTTCRELGRLEEAEAAYRRAVKIRPDYVEGHYNLAVVLNDLGRFDEAEEACRQALKIRPGYVEAFTILGVSLKNLGRLDEAIAALQRALEINPRYFVALNGLGSALNAQGSPEEAKEAFRKALQLRPDFAEAYNNLGVTLFDQGEFVEAEANYRLAIKYRPDYAQAHYNLGIVLSEMGKAEEGVASYQRAIQLDPANPDCYNNLGVALTFLGRFDEAETVLVKGLKQDLDHEGLLNNLGLALGYLGRPKEAEGPLRRALEIDPDHVEALTNLGMALMDQGRTAEAEACFRKALQLDPDNVKVYDSLLFTANYSSGHDAAKQLQDAHAFGALATRKAGTPFSGWTCNPNPERLRVGLVSGDLRAHPVGYFLEGLLSRIDPSRFELFAYSANHYDDELTTRIRPFFSSWKTLNGKNDADAAKLIHEDGIHLLLDLAGHSASNRLTLFAHRPAPVQATWLGYSGTTGLAEMDFLLGDPYVTPKGEEGLVSERPWRLPESYICLTPPEVSLEVSALPAAGAGCVTFGSFNNLAKMNDAVVAVWARILEQVPGSQLFLMTKLLSDPRGRDAVRQRFSAAGIDAERLILEGTSSREQVLEGYRRVDIALDTFPYTGTTTTAEALWMGVPVLTRRGDSFLSHVGESIVSNVGLGDWIAADDADYVAKATGFASRSDELGALRGALRARALASPLFDAPRFVRNFEAALWGMWEEVGRGKV